MTTYENINSLFCWESKLFQVFNLRFHYEKYTKPYGDLN